VHTDWKKIAAAICAAGVTASSVFAGPAGMTIASRPEYKSSSRATASSSAITPIGAQGPGEKLSPLRHPVKYMAGIVPDMPKSWKWGGNKMAAAVAPKNDALSLDKPAGPPSPPLMISMAQMCESQGDALGARRHYQQALSMWPGNVDVLRAAARMEDRQGQFQLAVTLYEQAVAANPQHAGAVNDLGLCRARQGRLDESIQLVEQAIQLQPGKPLYRNNAATILVMMHQDQRALAHLAGVHGPAEASFNLGQLLVQRGRSVDAAPYFQAAIEQNPSMQSAHEALARLQGREVPMSAPAVGLVDPAASPVGPSVVPQQGPYVGPQLGYPATASSPEVGTSSHIPPAYYAPRSPFAPVQGTRVGAWPQGAPRR
jgi:tetratricopeptide (TPR) repeat protein